MHIKKGDQVNILDVVPIRRDHILTHIKEDGKVDLGILRFKSKWVRKYLLPKSISPEIMVPLDAHGSEVWKLLDGESSVQVILESLQEHFQDDPGNYKERVVTYLYRLYKDKLIDFVATNK